MEPDGVQAPHNARRAGARVAVIVIAAILSVLTQTSLLSRVSTLLWLTSMPLCIPGCAILVEELAACRTSRQEEN